jgi:hypothetical protein
MNNEKEVKARRFMETIALIFVFTVMAFMLIKFLFL